MRTTKQKTASKSELRAQLEAAQQQLNEMRLSAMPQLNPEAMGAALGNLAAELSARTNLSSVAIKVAIGFVYGYTMMIACNATLMTIALLSIPAWITFVVNVLIAIAFVYATWLTITPVTNVVYNAGEKAVMFLRNEYHSLRGFLTEYSKEPEALHVNPNGTVATH